MKLSIALLITLFLITNVFAQESVDKWEIEERVDDLGDKAGKKIARYVSYGTFSNSENTKLDMIMKIVDYGIAENDEGMATIDFFDQNNNPANLALTTSRGHFNVSLQDNTVMTFRAIASVKSGLLIRGEDYKSFFKLVNNGKSEKINFVVYESDFDEYGSSTYTGHFHTKKNDQIY